MPRFSIVTICYNDAIGLASTIRSVGKQTFLDFEYVVQDGGSTDETHGMVRGFGDWIDKFESKPDSGIYDAMNKAVESCAGEFTLFLNSSDLFANEHVLENANQKILDEDQIVHGFSLNIDKGQIHDYKRLNDHKFGMVFDHQATFVKTEILRENPFDISLGVAGDLDFFCRCRRQGTTFRGIELEVAKKPFDVGASTDYLTRFQERAKVLLTNFPESEMEITFRLKSELLEYIEKEFGSEALSERLKSCEVDEILSEIASINEQFSEVFELQCVEG